MKTAFLSLTLLGMLACGQRAKSQKLYPITGTVISIDAKAKTANIDAAAIPNYMEAMKMDYPIASASDLSALRVGEKISATVTVSEDGSYALTNIHSGK